MKKSILVTGASSGIGAATARLMLAEGWTVGLLARRRDALEAVADGHPDARVLVADVAEAGEVEGAVRTFAEAAGSVDVLFNNAGIFVPTGEPDEVPLEDWEAALRVNLSGMFLAARAVWPVMRAQGGGRIVNNGSISAHVPREGAVCYTVTKHGVTGLTRQLALDGREHGIACGQIDIGNARTPMLEGLDRWSRETGGEGVAMMEVGEAARSVLHMATMPPEANVLFLTVMANAMPYVGRG